MQPTPSRVLNVLNVLTAENDMPRNQISRLSPPTMPARLTPN
jgi:hypothetical protein